MRKLTILAAVMAASTLASPAFAGNSDGHWQVKLLCLADQARP